jgi:hypothetical protein
MVEKWLHLNFFVGHPWGFLLVGAINNAVKAGRVPKPSNEQGQMPLYIATRLDMLPRIARRIGEERKLLYEAIRKHGPQHIVTPGYARQRLAFTVDEDLKFNLMIDIDSMLFEVHSCCEITTRLVGLVYQHVGKNIPEKDWGKTVYRILSRAGIDTQWYKDLSDNRNFFIHLGTLYIAVDLTREEEGVYDVLVMKENIHTFTDSSKFIRLSDIERIVHGFLPAMPAIENHLVSLYS